MRILLVADLEGVSLLDDWRAMWPDSAALYAAARQEITRDVNAAIRGLRQGGASEITVADGHGARLWPDRFNVIPESLEPDVQLVRGISTLDGGADFDALASMLAAQKLYPDALVVFPGSQEKNLRNFFINSMVYLFNMADMKDIDLSTIKKLVLVDTRQPNRIGQLANILKQPDLEIHIYDHHPHGK